MKNKFIVKSEPRKINIVSNAIFILGNTFKKDDIAEQRITINSDGYVSISECKFGNIFNNDENIEKKEFEIEKHIATNILNKINVYFNDEYNEDFATDSGIWTLEITDEYGEKNNFLGTLFSGFNKDIIDLSNLVRDSLERDDLYVFDGNYKEEKINRITIDYQRTSNIKFNIPTVLLTDYVNEFIDEHLIWKYKEQLIIDRETETIEHIQGIGANCKISHKYEIKHGISQLLDSLYIECLTEEVEGNNPDTFCKQKDKKEYVITVELDEGENRIIKGTYDKNGLPKNFAYFAEEVTNFIRFYGRGEILDSSIYGKVKPKKDEYIYCSVEIGGSYKSYYYIADYDEFHIGDSVIVPVGSEGNTLSGEITNIEYFKEKDVPYPIYKTKHIIGKEEEF